MRPATDKQLNFLQNLGYSGVQPEAIQIASMAIDMMKGGASSAETSRAVSAANKSAWLADSKSKKSCLGSCLVKLLLILLIVVAWLLAYSSFFPPN